jgi:hypothetical protein
MPGPKPRPLSETDVESMHEEKTSIRLATSQVMSIRFTSGELRKLSGEAAASGMTVGALVKRAALDATETHRYSTKPEGQFYISGGYGHATLGTKGMTVYQTAGSNVSVVEVA